MKDTLAAGRQAVTHCPQGSPQAGPVRVYSLETGEYIRTDKAWSPAFRDTPGNSIEQHTGSKWASNAQGTRTSGTQDDDPSGSSNH